MIKLIASDVDGTLLPEGTPHVNPELYEVILKLKEKGVVFAAASGRQYLSVHNVFRPVENDIIFIADNGAYVMCRGQLMEERAFDQAVLKEIVSYVRQVENVFYVVSSSDGMYTDSADEEFARWMKEGYRLDLETVEDVLEIRDTILKVAVFCRGIDATEVVGPMKEKFSGESHVMVSGAHWIDFMEAGADKGNALRQIQKVLNIKPEETMVFGDNLNDIGMFRAAGESYAVAGARPEAKEAAKHTLTDDSPDAVLHVLKDLLASYEK